jgi:phosphoglycolate phosphatase-like HAD superfamily hydrolase
MTMRGMIFDVDGTLVDTNPAHVEAWCRAFRRLGFEIPPERIVPEIGKGGDKLVPAILCPEVEDRLGGELREAQKAEFLEIARTRRFRVFPGATDIFNALQGRGIRTALATSSDEKHLAATSASAGIDLTRLPDVVVSRSPDEPSKPSPDLVVDAVQKLELPASHCAMVGDTVYDGEACQGAGVAFLGVLTGPATEQQLLDAGAIAVWRDVGHLLSELDRAIDMAALAATAGN